MPPLPAANKVLRLAFDFSYSEELKGVCRMHYSYAATAPSNVDLNEFCEDIMASVATNLVPLAGNNVTFTKVSATDLTSSTSSYGESASDHVGTRGNHALTAGDCAVMQRKVARRYRGGHSRVYWPFGIMDDLADSQTWFEASRVAFISGLGNLDTDIIGNGWTGAGTIAPVNVSYYSGFTVVTGTTGRARNVSTPRAAAVIDPVVEIQVAKGIGTQRRRMLRLA